MKTPAYIAAHIRRVLLDGASAPHTEEVQRFFKEEVQSRGWYTAELRKVAVRFRKAILTDCELKFLLSVSDELFRGRVLEEKVFAVFLLEGLTDQFGDNEFKLFAGWLDRVSSWAEHDALVYYLLSFMIETEPKRAAAVFQWAKSPNRWRRRAAAVALIRAARKKMCFASIVRLTSILLSDADDMVQKGLGWLLRESAKHNAKQTIPLLMKVRNAAPRLVLRTACEKLTANQRARILARSKRVQPASA